MEFKTAVEKLADHDLPENSVAVTFQVYQCQNAIKKLSAVEKLIQKRYKLVEVVGQLEFWRQLNHKKWQGNSKDKRLLFLRIYMIMWTAKHLCTYKEED